MVSIHISLLNKILLNFSLYIQLDKELLGKHYAYSIRLHSEKIQKMCFLSYEA